MGKIKLLLKKILPTSIINLLREIIYSKWIYEYYYTFLIKIQPLRYKFIVLKLKKKEKIKVAFFVTHSNSWKYDGIYKLMTSHDRFDPIIIICPVVNFGYENMLVEIDKCKKRFEDESYNVIVAYNKLSDEYLDVKKLVAPDVIFHVNPYKGLIDDRYYITNYLNCLNCYVSYAFNNTSKYEFNYNQLLHNLVWKNYVETSEYKDYAIQYSKCKGKNVEVTGYPGIDNLINTSYKAKDSWKIQDRNIKRIIWAPHHTIEPNGVINYSCFLQYHDIILKLADKYKNDIQIAFKPHPLLKVKLYKLWGIDKTNSYYEQWSLRDNCFLCDGDYIDLFLTSDAMVHDSGSFLIEYLFTKKPVMRTCFLDNWKDELNDFAKKCINVYYLGFNENDIENFIINIINNKDELKIERDFFVDKKLSLEDNVIPSKRILMNIEEELNFN